jgi:glycosyltransferase involved in cell wall biosynthesis
MVSERGLGSAQEAMTPRDSHPAPARPVKVLAVLASIDPIAGGPPNTCKLMWIAARRAGIELTAAICVKNPPGAAELRAVDALRAGGVEAECFPMTGPQRLAVRWGISLPLTLALLLNRRRYDVMQIHGGMVLSSMVAGLAAMLARKPLVVIPHESLTAFDIERNPNFILRTLKRVIKAWLLRNAGMFVFSTFMERRDSLSEADFGKTTVIYHPAYDDEAQHPGPRVWSSGGPALRAGFLGRFHSKKNLEMLLDAAAAAPGIDLAIAGDGPEDYRRRLRERVSRLGLDARVRWLGFVANEDLPAFFRSIDVLVMPSAYECFGRSAAEAMVNGVPTIVSDTVGMAEIIARHRCGIVVPLEVGGVRLALERLRDDPSLRTELSARAIKASEEELSLRSYGEAIAKVYRELAAANIRGKTQA